MLAWQRRRCKPWWRVLSLTVAICFSYTSTAGAASFETQAAASRRTDSTRTSAERSATSQTVAIPKTLGFVVEAYDPSQPTLSPSKKQTVFLSDHPTVIHLQDLHTHFGAQSNLAELLELLNRELGVSLVAVEGAEGYCDTQVFSAFPEKAINRRIARLFLKEGLFTGAEYQAIAQPNTLALYGVEDQAVYLEHLSTYQAGYANKAQVDQALSRLKAAIKFLQDQLYPSSLRELERKAAEYDEERLTFSQYLEHLFWLAGWSGIRLEDFPTLDQFRRLVELEGKADPQAAEAERLELLKELTAYLRQTDLQEVLKRSMDYRERRLAPPDYFSYLKQLARKYGIDIAPSSAFPNLAYYIYYVSLSERINYQKLSQELERLQETLRGGLLTSSDQRELAKLSRMTEILDGLYNVRLRPEDLAYYGTHQDEIAPEAFKAFFQRHRRLLTKQTPDFLTTLDTVLAFLFEHLPSQERFYQLALTRDTALIENTLRLMDERKQQAAVLIAGGFHTKGLTQVLKERNVAYVVISPAVEGQMDEGLYTSLLVNQVPTIPQLLDKLNGTALVQPLATSPTGDQVEVNSKDPDPFLKRDKDDKGKGPSKRTFVLIAWAILQVAQLVSYGWKQTDALQLFREPPLAYAYEVTASQDLQTLAVNGTKVELAFDAQGMPVARVIEEAPPQVAQVSAPIEPKVKAAVLPAVEPVAQAQVLPEDPLLIALLSIATLGGYLAYRWIKRRRAAGTQAHPLEGEIVEEPRGAYEQRIGAEIEAGGRPATGLRPELERQLQVVFDQVASGSQRAIQRMAPGGLPIVPPARMLPPELPMPIPLTLLRAGLDDRSKILEILRHMLQMMEGTDEKVIRDLERAIDNARDRVTEGALEQHRSLTDEELKDLLTTRYVQELEQEISRLVQSQIRHMQEHHPPSPAEQGLDVDPEVQGAYPFLPRYVKWLLSQNLHLLNDREVRAALDAIRQKLLRPPFQSEHLPLYADEAFRKSLYLNPELALRLLRSLLREAQVLPAERRREIEQMITQIEAAGTPAIIEPTPTPLALPEPSPEALKDEADREAALQRLQEQLAAAQQRLKETERKVSEQTQAVQIVEASLTELRTAREEAARLGERYTVQALDRAIEGFEAKLKKAQDALKRLEETKAQQESEVRRLQAEIDKRSRGGGIKLYGGFPIFDPDLWKGVGFGKGAGLGLALSFVSGFVTNMFLDPTWMTQLGTVSLGIGIVAGVPGAIGGAIVGKLAKSTGAKIGGMIGLTGATVLELFILNSFVAAPSAATVIATFALPVIGAMVGVLIGAGIHRLFDGFGKPSPERITKLLEDVEIRHRSDAPLLRMIKRIGENGDPQNAKALHQLFTPERYSAMPNVLEAAARALGGVKDREAVERLVWAVEYLMPPNAKFPQGSYYPHVRKAVAEALGIIGDERAIEPLKRTKPLSNAEVQPAIDRALAEIDKARHVPVPTVVTKTNKLPFGIVARELLSVRQEELPRLGEKITFSDIIDDEAIHALWGFLGWVAMVLFIGFGATFWDFSGVIGSIDASWARDFAQYYTGDNLLASLWEGTKRSGMIAVYWGIGAAGTLTIGFWVTVPFALGVGFVLAAVTKFVLSPVIDGSVFAVKSVWRLLRFPLDYHRFVTIHESLPDELSDAQLKKTAPLFARLRGGFLAQVLGAWVEVGQNAKVTWLVEHGAKYLGKDQATQTLAEVAGYNQAKVDAAARFTKTPQQRKELFDAIDRFRDRLDRKGIRSPTGLLKDVLPKLIPTLGSMAEFLLWMDMLTGLDKKYWEDWAETRPSYKQHPAAEHVVQVYNDLRGFEQAKTQAASKLATEPLERQPLIQRIEILQGQVNPDRVVSARVLREVIPVVAQAAQTRTEFFERLTTLLNRGQGKNWAGQQMVQVFGDLQAFRQARQAAADRFSTTPAERDRMYQAIDALNTKLYQAKLLQSGVQQPETVLKDVIPQITHSSRNLPEFLADLELIGGFKNEVWQGGKDRVIALYTDHVGFDRAKEAALVKCCQTVQQREQVSTALDGLKTQLEKRRQDTVNVLAELVPKVTQASATSDEFVRWINELASRQQTWAGWRKPDILTWFQSLVDWEQVKSQTLAKFARSPQDMETLNQTFSDLQAFVGKLVGTELPRQSLLISVTASLSQTNTTLSSFLFWVASLKRVRTDLWTAGPQQILKVYSDLREYRQQQEEFLARLTRSPTELAELRELIGRIEARADADMVVASNLMKRLLPAVVSLAQNQPQGFRTWLKFLDALEPNVCSVCVRDFEIVADYYRQEGAQRDWPGLPDALNRYHRSYGRILVITPDLLKHLTDGSTPLATRLEHAKVHLTQQKLIQLGLPPHLVNVNDPIDLNTLVSVAGGEARVKELLSGSLSIPSSSYDDDYGGSSTISLPVRTAMQKMGRDGLYTYFQNERPDYYQRFLEEVNGLSPDTFRPGEKFRVAYDPAISDQLSTTLTRARPIEDDVSAVKQLVKDLREKYPKLYDNFIGPKREIIRDRPLDELISRGTHQEVATRLLARFREWQVPDDEKLQAMMILVEVLAFPTTTPLHAEFQVAGDEFTRLAALTRYWEAVLEQLRANKWIEPKSKFYQRIVATLRERIGAINTDLGRGREGILQFVLSGKTYVDFFEGCVSQDCTSPWATGTNYSLQFIGTIVDPSSLFFKVLENGRWIANIYSVIMKDSEGKLVWLVDNFAIAMNVPLEERDSGWDGRRRNMAKRLMEQMQAWAGAMGFDYILMARDPSSRTKIKSVLIQAAQEARGTSKQGLDKVTVTGVSGTGHFRDLGISATHLQSLGGSLAGGSRSIEVYKIPVIKVDQTRQRKLQRFEELKAAYSNLRGQLGQLTQERTEGEAALVELQQSVKRAENAGQQVTAEALKSTVEEREGAVAKLIEEHGDLKARVEATETELRRLGKELGIDTSTIISPREGTKLYSFDPIFGLFAVAVAGLVFLLIWSILDWLRGEPVGRQWEYDFPRRGPPRVPVELVNRFRLVLDRISPELRSRVPTHAALQFASVGIPHERALQILNFLFTTLLRKGSIKAFLAEQPFYKSFKDETGTLGLQADFDQPSQKVGFTVSREGLWEPQQASFELELFSRDVNDILLGEISGDCTACFSGFAFHNTIPQFLLDPGFLDFKVKQEGKWVGNIYAIVAKREGRPVLVIDAIQLPPWRHGWPAPVEQVAEQMIQAVIDYAEQAGFQEVLMSSFVSNFHRIHDYLNHIYPTEALAVEKVGGFEHLKQLNLWDDQASRNEYLETFSPQWNYPAKLGRKVDPNVPNQMLLLRKIWKKGGSREPPVSPPKPGPTIEEPPTGTAPTTPPSVTPRFTPRPGLGQGFRKAIAGGILAFVLPTGIGVALGKADAAGFNPPSTIGAQSTAHAQQSDQPPIPFPTVAGSSVEGRQLRSYPAVVIGHYIKWLGSEDPEQKVQAIEGLGDMQVEEAVDFLIGVLRLTPEAVTHVFTFKALGKIGNPARSSLEAIAFDTSLPADTRHLAMAALARMKALPMVEFERLLLAMRQSPEWETRTKAALLLGVSASHRANEWLTLLLQDQQPDVRAAAALALGLVEDPSTLPMLMELLKQEPSEIVRGGATLGLGALGASAVESLIEMLKEPDSERARIAAEALIYIGMPAAEPLIKAIGSPDPNVKGWAAVALGKIPNPQAIRPLIQLLNDPGPEIREVAKRSLSQLKEAGLPFTFLERAKLTWALHPVRTLLLGTLGLASFGALFAWLVKKSRARHLLLPLVFFVGFSFLSPHISYAAQFFTHPTTKQTMAYVEKGDTLWEISGEARKGMVGPGRYAAHLQWRRIYDVNPQIKGRSRERMRPLGKEVVIIRPGEELVIPGEIGKDINLTILREAPKPEKPPLVAPAPGEKVTPPPRVEERRPPEEEKVTPEKRAEAERLQAQVRELQQEKAKLQEALSKLQQAQAQTQAEVQRLQQERQGLEERLGTLRTQIAEAEKQLQQLRQQAAEIAPLEEAKRKALVQEVERLETQRKQLEQAVQSMEAQRGNLAQRLETLTKELREAQGKITEARQALEQERATAEAVRKEKAQVETELQRLRTEHQKAAEALSALRQEQDQIEREISRLRQEESEARQVVEELRKAAEAAKVPTSLPEFLLTWYFSQPLLWRMLIAASGLLGIAIFLVGLWHTARWSKAQAANVAQGVQTTWTTGVEPWLQKRTFKRQLGHELQAIETETSLAALAAKEQEFIQQVRGQSFLTHDEQEALVADIQAKIRNRRDAIQTQIRERAQRLGRNTEQVSRDVRTRFTATIQAVRTLMESAQELVRDIKRKIEEAPQLADLGSRTDQIAKSITQPRQEIERLQSEVQARLDALGPTVNSLEPLLADPVENIAEIEQVSGEVTTQVERINALVREIENRRNVLTRHEQELKQILARAEAPLKPVVVPTAVDFRALVGKVPPVTLGLLNTRFAIQHTQIAEWLRQAYEASSLIQKIVAILQQHGSIFTWFQEQAFYQPFKNTTTNLRLDDQFDRPGRLIRFSVEGSGRFSLKLSDRDPEYLVRGFFSGDCTNCAPPWTTSNFISATGTHIVDPGFLNFEILRDDQWIGNVYVMVINEENKPVLVIDAIQIPWPGASGLELLGLSDGALPVQNVQEASMIADGVLKGLESYAKVVGFNELWLSIFVSNFDKLKEHYGSRRANFIDEAEAKRRNYPFKVTPAKKVGGYDYLQALGQPPHAYIESLDEGRPWARRVWRREAEAKEPTVTPTPSPVTPVPAEEVAKLEQRRTELQAELDKSQQEMTRIHEELSQREEKLRVLKAQARPDIGELRQLEEVFQRILADLDQVREGASRAPFLRELEQVAWEMGEEAQVKLQELQGLQRRIAALFDDELPQLHGQIEQRLAEVKVLLAVSTEVLNVDSIKTLIGAPEILQEIKENQRKVVQTLLVPGETWTFGVALSSQLMQGPLVIPRQMIVLDWTSDDLQLAIHERVAEGQTRILETRQIALTEQQKRDGVTLRSLRIGRQSLAEIIQEKLSVSLTQVRGPDPLVFEEGAFVVRSTTGSPLVVRHVRHKVCVVSEHHVVGFHGLRSVRHPWEQEDDYWDAIEAKELIPLFDYHFHPTEDNKPSPHDPLSRRMVIFTPRGRGKIYVLKEGMALPHDLEGIARVRANLNTYYDIGEINIGRLDAPQGGLITRTRRIPLSQPPQVVAKLSISQSSLQPELDRIIGYPDVYLSVVEGQPKEAHREHLKEALWHSFFWTLGRVHLPILTVASVPLVVVQGNDRLTHLDRTNRQIVIDEDSFLSRPLLRMELEHEMQHLILDYLATARGARVPPAVEEFVLSLLEVKLFLTYLPALQANVLDVLKADNDLDEQQFYRVLEIAQREELEPILGDLFEYLKRAYSEEIRSYLERTPKHYLLRQARELLLGTPLFDSAIHALLLKAELAELHAKRRQLTEDYHELRAGVAEATRLGERYTTEALQKAVAQKQRDLAATELAIEQVRAELALEDRLQELGNLSPEALKAVKGAFLKDCQRLEGFGLPVSLRLLAVALYEPSIRIPWLATDILSHLADRSYAGFLVQLAKDADPLLLRRIANLLGKLKDPRAIEPLAKRLDSYVKSSDSIYRYDVAWALLQFDRAAIPALKQALEDERTREGATAVLQQLAEQQLRQLSSDNLQAQESAQLGLVGIGQVATPLLLRVLTNAPLKTKVRIISILGHIGDPNTISTLVEALKDKSLDVCKTAASALAQIAVYHPLSNFQRDALVSILTTELLHNRNGYTRFLAAWVLGNIKEPKATPALVRALHDSYVLVYTAAAEALEEIHWQPQTADEQVFYYISKKSKERTDKLIKGRWEQEEIWDEVVKLGFAAVPILTKVLEQESRRRTEHLPAVRTLGKIGVFVQDNTQRNVIVQALVKNALQHQDKDVRQAAAEALDQLNWKPSTLDEQVFYYVAKQLWDDVGKLGPLALPALMKALQDSWVRGRAVKTLSQFQPLFKDLSPGLLHAILIFHSEWFTAPPSKAELEAFARPISLLPPVGGKIPLVIGQEGEVKPEPGLLVPSWTAEEQAETILELRRQGKLGHGYVHQLTVQGRLLDEFKYVALALIISSPYQHDWSEPFFEAPWGKVAPLVHDGGNVEVGLNPLWQNVEGRTDFLQRVVKVYVPRPEELERLHPEDQLTLLLGEQDERLRLQLEAKAYQRLALALHAKLGNTPATMSEDLHQKLVGHWEVFKQRMDALLGEFDARGAAQVTWFTEQARELPNWSGPRHEAEWEPIKQQLIHLEQIRTQYPQLRAQIIRLLQQVTDAIDRDLGLPPSPPQGGRELYLAHPDEGPASGEPTFGNELVRQGYLQRAGRYYVPTPELFRMMNLQRKLQVGPLTYTISFDEGMGRPELTSIETEDAREVYVFGVYQRTVRTDRVAAFIPPGAYTSTGVYAEVYQVDPRAEQEVERLIADLSSSHPWDAQEQAEGALLRMGPSVIPKLLPLPQGPDAIAGYRAARIISKLNPRMSTGALIRVLEAARASDALALAKRLQGRGDPNAISSIITQAMPFLILGLRHPDDAIRSGAMLAVTSLGGGPERTEALYQALETEDRGLRGAVAYAIVAIGDSTTFPVRLLSNLLEVFEDAGPFPIVGDFVARVIRQAAFDQVDETTRSAFVPHVLRYFPQVGEPYRPILLELRHVGAISDVQFNTAVVARRQREGLKTEQEGIVQIVYLGYPIVGEVDPDRRAAIERNAKVTGLPILIVNVFDQDYDLHGDGYALATYQWGPSAGQEPFWMYLGERLSPEEEGHLNIQKRLATGEVFIWQVNGTPYLKQVFRINGEAVVPFGVSATGDQVLYHLVRQGAVVSCCIQFHDAEQTLKGLLVGSILSQQQSPYRALPEVVKTKVELLRQDNPALAERYFGEFEESGRLTFTEEGKQWLKEQVGVSSEQLQAVLELEALARTVDVPTMLEVRRQLKRVPFGIRSLSGSFSAEPADSHRRALARVVGELTGMGAENIPELPRVALSERRFSADPIAQHRFTSDAVGGMAGKVYAFDLSIFAEKVDGRVQVNSTTFHMKLEELVGQLRDVFGEDWRAYVKIVLAHFGTEEDMAVLEEALKQLVPDITYDRLVAVGTVDQLVETLDETYGSATSKTIVVKDTHVVPPGRMALPQLTEPEKPIQIIVVNSANQAEQEILSGAQAVALAVEPEFFAQNEELKDLVHWEQWDAEKKVGVLDLEALQVTPEFSVTEEVERKRLQEQVLSRQARYLPDMLVFA